MESDPQWSDEELQMLINMGALDDQGRALDDQSAQAQALMQGGGQAHSSWGGALLGGLSDAARAYMGSQDMKDVKGARQALTQERLKGRKVVADALNRRRQQTLDQQAPGTSMTPSPVPQALAPTSPFSFGGAAPGGYGYTPGGGQ